jgi:acetyltransferase-like isoleucine patch superfamily enzyme
LERCVIGNFCRIGSFAKIHAAVALGDNSHISAYSTSLWERPPRRSVYPVTIP